MKTFKQFLTEANETTSKYEAGDFGYWWVEVEGNKDIEGKVYNGDIDCRNKRLTSLKGCPKEVKGEFICRNNKLTSLKGAPEKVEGFYCCGNKLTSLEGGPKEVNGYFDCYWNKLTSLKGCPTKVRDDFDCGGNEVDFDEDDVRSLCKVGGKIEV